MALDLRAVGRDGQAFAPEVQIHGEIPEGAAPLGLPGDVASHRQRAGTEKRAKVESALCLEGQGSRRTRQAQRARRTTSPSGPATRRPCRVKARSSAEIATGESERRPSRAPACQVTSSRALRVPRARVSVPVEAQTGGGHLGSSRLAGPQIHVGQGDASLEERTQVERRSFGGGGETSGRFHSPSGIPHEVDGHPLCRERAEGGLAAESGGVEPHGGARHSQEGWVPRTSQLEAVHAGFEAQRLDLEAVQASLQAATP